VYSPSICLSYIKIFVSIHSNRIVRRITCIREIIKPTSEEYTIKIPKEYLDAEVEIIVLLFSLDDKQKNKTKNLSKLLEVSVWDMNEEDIRVKVWKIEEF